LIGVGGVLYSVGTGFYLWRALPFHNAIWHGFVLVAASLTWPIRAAPGEFSDRK